MSDHANSERWDSPGTTSPVSDDFDGVDSVEAYDIDGGVVFYDAQNPLAWVETSRTVRLDEYA